MFIIHYPSILSRGNHHFVNALSVFVIMASTQSKVNHVCKNCSSLFPDWIIVAGRRRSLSNRRYCLTCSPLVEDNDKRNKRHLKKYRVINGIECKQCNHCKEFKPITQFRYGECKDCSLVINRERKLAKKLRAIEYKGGKCTDCDGIFPPCAYDFHHLDPSQKDFTIGFGRDMLWEKVLPELDKCVLLCATCHRIRHFIERSDKQSHLENDSL